MTRPSDEEQKRYLEIWAKAVDTQMHFNEMSVKSRQLGLTFVAAALGVAVVLLSRGEDFALEFPKQNPRVEIHISVLLIGAAALGLLAVRTLDLNVYHRMLRGAVTFGEDFEEHYLKRLIKLNKGMTQAISHYSRYQDAECRPNPTTGKLDYSGRDRTTAEEKIRSFYRWTLWFLVGTAIALLVLTNLDTLLTAVVAMINTCGSRTS